MEAEDNNGRGKQIAISAGIVVVIALTIIGVVAFSNKKSDTTASTTSTNQAATSTASDSTTTATTATTGSFKAGTYEATGSYTNPGGSSDINISVTIDGTGTITATEATEGTSNRESQEYQQKFISGYKSQVVGKKITDVQLSRVSGSSLTSKGFNDAIAQIEKKAQA